MITRETVNSVRKYRSKWQRVRIGVSVVIRASFPLTCCTHKRTFRKISRCKKILAKISDTEIRLIRNDQSLGRRTVHITLPYNLVYT
jgi:hypothetical protein